MSWQITTDENGASTIRHLGYPGFAAQWTTGDDPEELADVNGLCWTDEGAGQGDQIHLYGFMWVDDKPDQAGFEALMQEASREIDRYVLARL